MAKLDVEVGRSLRDATAEVGAAWKAAEAGQPVIPTDRVYFQNWDTLCAVLTPRRLELLRHLRRSRESGVQALARALDRDVERVREDVTTLESLGLVTKAENGNLSSDVDEITSTIHIAA